MNIENITSILYIECSLNAITNNIHFLFKKKELEKETLE